MTTLQSTVRRRSYAINYIETPRWVEIIAIIWLIWEDHVIPALRILIAKNEVHILVKYDKTQRVIKSYGWLFPVARVFAGLWCVFLLIALLEEVVKWLH